MNFVTLPPELVTLEGKVFFVQQVSINEYHMSCPACGVQPHHSDSHPSDRFIVWIESRISGKPFGMCRSCGWKWSSDKHDAVWTEEEKAVFIAKRKELNERENQRIAEYSKNVVMKQAVYLRYMENLKKSQYGQKYLSERGFNSVEWNTYFGYGIFEDYKCRGFLDTYYAPAITMPVTGLNKIVENVKLRVTDAHHEKDRFRNLYATKAQHPYLIRKGFDCKGYVWNGLLALPMRVGDSLVGCQLIQEDGTKRFLSGQVTKGASLKIDAKGRDILCEGFATGMSVRNAMRHIRERYTIHVCFSAGNMLEIAKGLRNPLVIADNDASGTGEGVAKKIASRYWLGEAGEDFNDAEQRLGTAGVADTLRPFISS